MISWLKDVLRGDNRHLSMFFPAITFGYIYTTGLSKSVCKYQLGTSDIWIYTGLNPVVYLWLTFGALVVGSMSFVIADEELYREESSLVDISAKASASLDFMSIIALFLRVCKHDLVINSLLFLTFIMWFTQLFHGILVRQPWK